MSIFKKYGIKRTRENVATVERILRTLPSHGKALSEDTRDAAKRLMLALDRDGWDGIQVFDLLPFKGVRRTQSRPLHGRCESHSARGHRTPPRLLLRVNRHVEHKHG